MQHTRATEHAWTVRPPSSTPSSLASRGRIAGNLVYRSVNRVVPMTGSHDAGTGELRLSGEDGTVFTGAIRDSRIAGTYSFKGRKKTLSWMVSR